MENPVCSSSDEKKFNSCSSPTSSVICEKDKDHVTFNYAHFDSKLSRHNMINRQRWMLPYCTLFAVLVACGALLGLVGIYVELCRSNAILQKNRELIHAQDMKILNQTYALDRFKTELKNVKSPGNGQALASRLTTAKPSTAPGSEAPLAAGGSVFVRWGLDECPNTSALIYAGVAASGSSLTASKGNGGNFLCMTPEPEYGPVSRGRQEPRGRIYGVEYRNGNSFGPQSDLHGHDMPCATCMTAGGRKTMMMIPGKPTCPENWTREYQGILMSARYNNVRSSYVCVDIEAESRPGTMREDGNSSLLFPVEGICGPGGGLPCGPYVDGLELQCAVCSM